MTKTLRNFARQAQGDHDPVQPRYIEPGTCHLAKCMHLRSAYVRKTTAWRGSHDLAQTAGNLAGGYWLKFQVGEEQRRQGNACRRLQEEV